MEFIGYLIVFVLGFFAGNVYLAYKIKHLLQDFIEDVAEDVSSDAVYKLKTELLNGTLFLYDSDDNFVCQGSTIEELAKLSKDVKHINYASVLHGDKIVVFVNGEVTEQV